MHEFLKQFLPFGLYLVANNERHTLLPIYREVVYRELERNMGEYQLVASQMEFITAGRAYQIWTKEQPLDVVGTRLMKTMQQALAQPLNQNYLSNEVTQAFQWRDAEYNDGQGSLNDQSFFALSAIIHAMRTMTGRRIFYNLASNLLTDDSNIDVIDLDVAGLVANCVAGPLYDMTSSDQLRKEFWTWWLTTVLPLSWGTAFPHPVVNS